MIPTSADVQKEHAGAAPLASVMHYAFREALAPSMLGLAAMLVGSLTLIIAIFGPWGSHEVLSLVQRLAYCAPVFALDALICYPAFVFTLYVMRSRPHVQILLALAVMVLVLAAACTAIAYTALDLYRARYSLLSIDEVAVTETYLVNVAILLNPVALTYYVLWQRVAGSYATQERAVSAGPSVAERGGRTTAETTSDAGDSVVAAVSKAVADDAAEDVPRVASGADDEAATHEKQPTTAPQAANEPQSPFFGRLPAELGRDLVFLKMAGHYLEVTTIAGSASILMRLGDAAAELGDMGMRVHRSYWVAHRHVTGVERRGNRAVLHLDGAHDVPVSLSFVPAVRQRYPEQES